MRALVLHLEAPLQSYGSEAVDSRRATDEMPGLSMLTGLLGNALGYRRTEARRLETLQSRISYAARVDRRGEPLRDFQTAGIAKADTSWSTWGVRQERGGGEGSYDSPHIRYLDYHADRVCVVALALSDESSPTLDELHHALRLPARPLFLGRKACLPSAPISAGIREGSDLLEILMREPLRAIPDSNDILVQVNGSPGDTTWWTTSVADRCDWRTRSFGGARQVARTTIHVDRFARAA